MRPELVRGVEQAAHWFTKMSSHSGVVKVAADANGGGRPVGKLAAAIDSAFGSFDEFQKKFAVAAVGHFASGWAWLSVDPSGKLLIETTPGHDSPIMAGRKPVLVLDLWEHAY